MTIIKKEYWDFIYEKGNKITVLRKNSFDNRNISFVEKIIFQIKINGLFFERIYNSLFKIFLNYNKRLPK